MTLIKSISGIRGTIGGRPGESLSPVDLVKYTTAYCRWAKEQDKGDTIVIGRDARISGPAVSNIVCGSLMSMGFHVIDLGLATTPTVEMAVTDKKAAGGIIFSASHNPIQWNALKLLNSYGEFLSAAAGERILELAEDDDFDFPDVLSIGSYSEDKDYLETHIEHILALELVDIDLIKERKFKVVVDGVNSVGGIAVPALLEKLGVEVECLYCEPTGHFPHNPEPLPQNLGTISHEVQRKKADLGIVVDPDVDRLAFVNEDGTMFGEEYTLVAIADYILSNKKGATVSNLSSTKALEELTKAAGCKYIASAVGEVNVVSQMKANDAVIGGEGNGGIIYPELHYGRDALVGIALFLSHLAKTGLSCSNLRSKYPQYVLSKNKIELTPEIDVDLILNRLQEKYKNHPINTIDGVYIEFDADWVHLRKSNTEPIIRIYSESDNEVKALAMVKQIQQDIKSFL